MTGLQDRFEIGRSMVLRVVLGGLLAVAAGGALALDAPEAKVLAFDRFISLTAPICRDQPAPECVDLAFDFADYDGDQALSRDELRVIRDSLAAWATWRKDALSGQERNGITLGLWIVDTVGLEALQESYDEDGDGVVSRGELLADVRLDGRPLGEVLLDPEAVDRAAVLRRLGSLAPFVEGALP